MGVGGQRHVSVALPPGKTQYPFYRRFGGPQDRSGPVQKISPPPEFDPRTVQPVASRYTDWAIETHAVTGGIILKTLEDSSVRVACLLKGKALGYFGTPDDHPPI
jgi:hypothetical protein